MRYSMAAASMAHTYGNVTTFINNWLLSLFPKEYFKTNYINSTIAYKDFATYNNNRKQFIKKQKPMLIIRPRIEIDVQDELPINQTYLANRIYDVMCEDIETGNLQNFFWDKDNNRQIQFLLNALRINFDVRVVFSCGNFVSDDEKRSGDFKLLIIVWNDSADEFYEDIPVSFDTEDSKKIKKIIWDEIGKVLFNL